MLLATKELLLQLLHAQASAVQTWSHHITRCCRRSSCSHYDAAAALFPNGIISSSLGDRNV